MTVTLAPMPERAGGICWDWPRGFNWMITRPREIVFTVDEKLNLLAQVVLNQSDAIAELAYRVKRLEGRAGMEKQ